MIKLSAALFAFAQIAPGNLPAQTNIPQHQIPISDQKNKQNPPVNQKPNNPPLKRIISGTVVTQVNDTTKLPLACAELTVVRGAKVITVETDSFGRFVLDLTNIYSSLPDTFEIVVSHPRTATHTIKYVRKDLKLNQRNIVDAVLADVSIRSISVKRGTRAVQSYYAMPYTPPKNQNQNKPNEVKESKIKRWWRHLWKKDKK